MRNFQRGGEPRPQHNDVTLLAAVAAELSHQLAKAPDERAEAEKAIAATLVNAFPNLDAYALARQLEEEHGWGCDTNTVYALDGAASMLAVQAAKQIAAWVTRHQIAPQKAIGDAVSVQAYVGRKLVDVDGEICDIDAKHANYMVYVPALGHVREGFGVRSLIVPYEHIHDLVAAPEAFPLSPG